MPPLRTKRVFDFSTSAPDWRFFRRNYETYSQQIARSIACTTRRHKATCVGRSPNAPVSTNRSDAVCTQVALRSPRKPNVALPSPYRCSNTFQFTNTLTQNGKIMTKQITYLLSAARDIRPVLAIGLVSVGLAVSAKAASFDCSRAATTVEKLICATPRLSALDDLMHKDYMAISASNIGDAARAQLKSSQRAWLKTRNGCQDAACIENSYSARMDQVCGDYPVLSGAFPSCVSGPDDIAAAVKTGVAPTSR